MHIALPAPVSRMYEPARKAVSKYLELPEAEGSSRELTCRIGDHTVVMCRGSDIPTLVGLGVADIGITGYDVAVESVLISHMDLEIRSMGTVRTSFVSFVSRSGRQVDRIYTEYPKIAETWLLKRRVNRDVELVHVTGSSEGLVAVDGLSAGVVLVTSGQTLAANGLDYVVPLLATDVCLIYRATGTKPLDSAWMADLPSMKLPEFVVT